jgi:choline dehydrogenase-like flavoprotein
MRDPHAGVSVFSDYDGPLRAAADYVVIGSGPGGAVVAKELAERGGDVVLVEEGPPFGQRDFVPEPGASMRRTLRESGMRVARGRAFLPTMQAIGLGGGSLVNSAICVRPPAWVFEKWRQHHGDAPTRDELDPHFDRVEDFLGIAPTEEAVLGERNRLFRQGCDALGIPSEPCPRNVRRCRGSGECLTGCRAGAKQSTDVSYVPAAIARGARVFTSVRAERIRMQGARAVGVGGHVVAPFTGAVGPEVELEARKAVVLAAGCVATPIIMARSDGASGPSGQVGRNLQFHPGAALMGIWDHEVRPWEGATQGYQSLAFLEQGYKLEVLWAPPAILATRFPGFGHEFKDQLGRLAHMAPFDVIAAADRSSGTVRPKLGSWDPDLRYELDPEDEAIVHAGLVKLAEIMWAAGAREIITGMHGLPEVITRDQHRLLVDCVLKAENVMISCNHVFGTTRMGRDPRRSVVDAHGRCHHTDNLWIADTGIIPMSPAVNPMLVLMALADRIAGDVADAHG